MIIITELLDWFFIQFLWDYMTVTLISFLRYIFNSDIKKFRQKIDSLFNIFVKVPIAIGIEN